MVWSRVHENWRANKYMKLLADQTQGKIIVICIQALVDGIFNLCTSNSVAFPSRVRSPAGQRVGRSASPSFFVVVLDPTYKRYLQKGNFEKVFSSFCLADSGRRKWKNLKNTKMEFNFRKHWPLTQGAFSCKHWKWYLHHFGQLVALTTKKI